MQGTVQKWGNSLALRIPHSFAKDIHLSQGATIELKVVGGELVVRPAKQKKYTLGHLLRGVTKQNRHDEETWGQPLGLETW